ncbi:MAG: hypothetical protein A3J60_00315 [Candidatus Pacebacteria bacterium RIFCSPHIGHO2_02_FULL_46_9]|nr:MAG: hypothetical protein A3J60_00315 [Candidatus Pacebacteria bacterium RIFCSPHIGHO2_02_FULL_46_9]
MRGNYTHQVDNPEVFLRFDLTEGICWFPQMVSKWLREISLDLVAHYPNASTTALQELISKWLSFPADKIAIGNGSDELIEIIPQLFLNPGDECVVVTPTFFRFAEASNRAGASIRQINLRIDDRFTWTPKVIKKFELELKRPKVKLIWLASPNNPTGVSVPSHVLEMAVNSRKMVVLDKVLNGFSTELQSAAKLISDHENLIVLSGFSKTFGLPGLRLGFALSSTSNAKLLRDRRLSFSISGISVFLLRRLLESLINKEIRPSSTHVHNLRRKWLEIELRKLRAIKLVSNSTTNLLLLQSCRKKQLFEELKKNGVLATDLNELAGVAGLGLVRISVRSQKENEVLVKKLKKLKE